jgi:hypothetical protein
MAIRNTPDCPPLLSAASLSIYRNNVFRVTGLAVDATNKQAKRRADELKMLQEAGMEHAAQGAVFALNPPPSVDDIRHSIAKLEEPEHRLVDEFFWFWPLTFGESTTDPALQALAKGDSSSAYDIWTAGESDPVTGFVATHNLAIMLHLIALDWTNYHLAAEVDGEREEKIRNYWKEAFQRWEKIAIDDRIWDAVKTRIRDIDDPRLTTGFGRRMRETLPEALDKINAEAALKFAEQGQLAWAKSHIAYMRETHQGQDDVEKTAEMVLAPSRTRVQQHIATARDAIKNDPKKGAEAAEHLLVECTGLHELFELFHGEDAHQTTELFDEVALAAVDCAVAYQKATADNEEFVVLLKAALPFATSMDVRQRIQKNIGIGEGNIRGKAIEPLYAKLKLIQENGDAAKLRLSQIKTVIMPELAKLVESEGMDAEVVADFSDAIAIVVRGISIDAHNDEEDYETAFESIQLAMRLAKSSDLKSRTKEDSKVLEENLTEFKRGQVDLDIKGDRIRINREVVQLNSQQIRVVDVTGVLFGIFIQYRNGIQSSCSYLVGVQGGGASISIECKRFWRSEEQAKSDYSAILDGLFRNVFPKLAPKIATQIASGTEFKLGATRITMDGIYIRSGVLMWEKETLVPWSDVRYGNHQGHLSISSAKDSKLRVSMAVRDTWNAVIFEPVVKTLMELRRTSASK